METSKPAKQSKRAREKPIIMGSMKNKIVASCLQEERDKCDFDANLGGGYLGLLD